MIHFNPVMLLIMLAFALFIGLFMMSLKFIASSQMNDTAKALWTMIVLFFPILGAITLLVVKPGDLQKNRL